MSGEKAKSPGEYAGMATVFLIPRNGYVQDGGNRFPVKSGISFCLAKKP
jgi:hypothetical protein